MDYSRTDAKAHAEATMTGIWAAALMPFTNDLRMDEDGTLDLARMYAATEPPDPDAPPAGSTDPGTPEQGGGGEPIPVPALFDGETSLAYEPDPENPRFNFFASGTIDLMVWPASEPEADAASEEPVSATEAEPEPEEQQEETTADDSSEDETSESETRKD